MAELKPITPEGIPTALQKAHRYRLLNDSQAAESICEDVLALDPQNIDAQITYVLSLTDQFAETMSQGLSRAREAVARIADPYRNAYYNGIVCERWAKVHLRRAQSHSMNIAYEWFDKAMKYYATAEAMRPAGNDEAILRWNTCVRVMAQHPKVRPAESEEYEPSLE